MSHTWKFFRAGGFDQVRLDTAEDLLAIGELNQKLWVALSCPVKGIEFDARTLQLIDVDSDGQVRAPELINAVQWAGARLKDTAILVAGRAGLPLTAIRDDDETGIAIVAAARALMSDLGKTDGDKITVEEASAAQARFAEKALAGWESAGSEAKVLGDATADAHAALGAVAAKIEDWFVRCQLAAFDDRAGAALNAADDAFAPLAAATLTADAPGIAQLPLAKVGAGETLPLGSGVNPAWTGAMATLRDKVVTPLLGNRDRIDEAEWNDIKEKFAPYAAWLAAKPDPAAQGDGVRELERLARYVRDLRQLADNFVSFREFYTHQPGTALRATFQLGTLYLDGRACELCVAVNDPAKHAALATLSRICLVYCDCRRGSEKMSIAAAFTAGDSDQLMAGRNGVFYDRQGRDWDATITKIIDHPISLRQAFWSPYKKLARMVAEQLQKVAASKAAAVEGNMANVAGSVGKKVETSAKAPPAPFDVGKFAGIFAAIGLAIGALGTALAAMVTGILGLQWWQMPLALIGLMLIISGPAVAMAWFKLRSRNLGPILDANGWAVNARARINIPFGTSLTQLAQLPEGSERSLADPYADKGTPWGRYLFLGAVLAAAAWWWLRHFKVG